MGYDEIIIDPSFEIDDLSIEEIEAAYHLLTPEEKQHFDDLLRNSPPRSLMPHQAVPTNLIWWEVFLLVGGRGTGKTVCGASETRKHLRLHKSMARCGIGAPTTADTRDTCMEGETGLITMFPNEFVSYNRSMGEARHVDGGIVKAMGTEKPGRWNGPQWSFLWFDELALCNQSAWDMANFGLRLGPRPYAVATTTPKNKKWVKQLALDKTTLVPQYVDEVTGRLKIPTTMDNPNLPKRRVDWLINKYGGTRIGRQEIEGLFIDDVDGALWKRDMIENSRCTDPDDWPRMVRTIVAIDPAGSRARKEADKNALTEEDRQNQRKNADTAIAVVGLGEDKKFYVIHISSGQWSPTEWASKAIEFFHMYRADKIVAEKNFGGDMVESTLRNIDQWSKKVNRQLKGRHIPIKLVTASKGKDIRAEPVVTLYEQSKVVHCGNFPEAEDQMCAFIDADDNEGADMVDALVWAIIELGGLEYVSSQILIGAPDPRMRAFITY